MENKKEKLVDALISNMGNITNACKSVGTTRRTYYNWLEADKDFAESVSHINESVIDEVESCLMANIRGGNVTAQIFYLKTKARYRGYTERIEQEIASKDGTPLGFTVNIIHTKKDASEMTDAELMEIINEGGNLSLTP